MNPTRDYKRAKFKGELKGAIGIIYPSPLVNKLARSIGFITITED